MRLIDYIAELRGDICPHCVPNLTEGMLGTYLLCGKSNIGILVTDGVRPCTLEDWGWCPLNKENGGHKS